jgi:hypothetical protein
MQLSVGLVVPLLFVAGLLLSRIHFCMVAAVARARLGDWDTARAIGLISLGVSLVLLVLALATGSLPRQLPADWRILAGGLLFGFTAAWNRGCFVGTSIQLAGGDLRALISMVGWVLGFVLVGSPMAPVALSGQLERITASAALILLLLLCLAWRSVRSAGARPPERQPVHWRISIVCGGLLALVDHDQWPWDPSALARALAHPLNLAASWHRHDLSALLALVLLAGMAAEALRQRRLQLVLPRGADLVRLGFGIGMAVGAALAMGGNDSQLLRFLPAGSPHGWIAVPAMLLGILGGLNTPSPAALFRLKP